MLSFVGNLLILQIENNTNIRYYETIFLSSAAGVSFCNERIGR